jgi:iron complex outermembrane receptor protein
MIRVFGSAGKGFSTPSFEETLLPEGIRNDDLKPEKGWNLDLGLRADLLDQRLHLNISAYAIFIRDLLVTERVTEEIFTGINAGRILHRGIESSLRWMLLGNRQSRHQLSLDHHFDASFCRFEDFVDEGIDYAGKQLPGIPAFKSSTRISWRGPANLASSASLLATGRQYLTDDNLERYPGYQTVDWHISWSPAIFDHLSVSAAFGVNNLFDQHYASMILINAPSFGNRPPRYYYPGMPRNIYLQLRIGIN